MNDVQRFAALNAGYLAELYERYQRDPASVDEPTRAYFAREPQPPDGSTDQRILDYDKVVAVVNLAHAIRALGHLAARLDPLGTPPIGDPLLDLSTHGLSVADLQRLPASLVGGPVAQHATNAYDAIAQLRVIYATTTGYEFDHVRAPAERAWLRDAAEARRFYPDGAPAFARALLARLTQVEAFEVFLHRAFPGKTRFSIEGLDMLVPMLDAIVGAAVELSIHKVLLGMAHRGRLNVLAHVLNKPYVQLLAAFKDARRNTSLHAELGWTGDVRY